MRYGGRMTRRLRSFANGGDNQEMEAVMQQVQEMMSQGADAKQVMEQIQAAAQQGQISPETAAAILEQLSGMQQAENPQGSDMSMTARSQDPQMLDPNMATPDSAMGMAKFGGNLKKLMSRAYGGQAVAPGTDSKTYAKDRASMFVNAVKNNAFKSTIDNEFPSLAGNQMAYGGNLPKAVNGIEVKDGKLSINPKAYKSEDEYLAAVYRWNSDPKNKEQQVTNELVTTNKWTQQPDSKANYRYDEATGQYIAQPAETKTNQFQFQEGDVMGQRIPATQNQNYNYSSINPVDYGNPYGGFWGNAYAGTSPFARLVAGSGNRFGDPRLTGSNLPGGMNANQFLGAVGGFDKLASGMTGTVGDQTWRVGAGEKFKEGSIWKGNRRKGVRYTIDWGNAAAMNSQGTPRTNPQLTGPGPQNWNNVDDNENTIPDYLEVTNSKQPSGVTVLPGSTNVVNPASEVDEADQTVNAMDKLSANYQMYNDKGFANADNPYLGNYADPENYFQEGNVRKNARQFYKENFPNLPNKDRRDLVKYAKKSNQVMTGLTGRPKNIKSVYTIPNYSANKQEDEALKSIYNNETKKWEAAPTAPAPTAPVVVPTAPAPTAPATAPAAIPPVSTDFNQEELDKRKSTWLKMYENLDKRTPEEVQAEEKYWNEVYLPYSKLDPNYGKEVTPPKAYGGNVDPAALENAIALINRAFGGGIPKASMGYDLTSSNDIPVLDQNGNQLTGSGSNMMMDNNNMPTFQNNSGSGTIEQSLGKKMNINWDAVGDFYANNAPKFTNIMDRARAYDPEREQVKNSALKRPRDTYDTMSQGVYDQAGNFIPNDIGNQVLNPTNSNYNNQPTVFSYGGRVYEIGGEVDLDDDQLLELEAAGLKLSRV
jgi:hypothetical protein